MGRAGHRRSGLARMVPLISASLMCLVAIVTAELDNKELARSIIADREFYNATCSSKDICKIDKGSRISDVPDWKERNCMCDDLCATYGDCCPDAKAYKASEQKAAVDRFKCMVRTRFGGSMMVATCPAAWKDDETRQSCEAEWNALEVARDPLFSMPVTSKASRLTYKNVHCAVCNEDTPEPNAQGEPQLRFWSPRLEYHGNANPSDPRLLNASSRLYWNEKEESWGMDLPDRFTRKMEFARFILQPFMPEDVQLFVRPCRYYEGRCPDSYTDEDIKTKCESYTSLIYSHNVTYRNVHCAVCNDANVNELTCWEQVYARDFRPSFGSTNAFALLFDLNDADGSGEVGKTKKCNAAEMYDPFAKRCRRVLCLGAGQSYREGKCIEQTTTSTTSTTTTSTTTPSTTTPVHVTTTTSPPSSSTPTSTSTTAGTLPSSTTTTTTEFVPIVFPTDEDFELPGEREESTTATSTTPTSTTSTPASSTTTTPSSTTTTVSSSTTSTESTTVVSTSVPNFETKRNFTESTTVSTTVSTTTTTESGTSTTTTAPAESVSPSSEFSTCPKFLLGKDEVQFGENGTVYVPAYDKMFSMGEYVKHEDGGIFICALGVTNVPKFDPVLGWITIAGLGVSEICLAVHIIASIITPELHNLSGRNVASLSVALFAAYGSFMAVQFVSPSSEPSYNAACVTVAVLTHYFFLAAFWWTSVLAWDVWRTLRLATVELRAPSGKQTGKFILYSLWAWLGPAFVVAAAVVVDFVDLGTFVVPPEFHPNFGNHVCWFGQRKALLIYFAAPLAAILGVNLVLFLFSAYMINSTTTKAPSSPSSSASHSQSRKQLGLYVRLALLMGLSWVAGLVAGAADLTPLWYVFVALCSLQGLFILLAFTCNPKVMRSLRNRAYCCGGIRRRRPSYKAALVGSGSSNTGGNRRSGLEPRDSHDSQASNTSNTSSSSLSKTTSTMSNSSSR